MFTNGRNRILLLSCVTFLLFFSTGNAQSADTTLLVYRGERHRSLLVGYNGFRHHFAEVGIAWNQDGAVGHQTLGTAYFVSTEVSFGKQSVTGIKAGAWMGGGIAFGLNAIYYTDFGESSLRLRPEVGLGMHLFKLVYGYNAALTNKEFSKINTHNFCVVFLLRRGKE